MLKMRRPLRSSDMDFSSSFCVVCWLFPFSFTRLFNYLANTHACKRSLASVLFFLNHKKMSAKDFDTTPESTSTYVKMRVDERAFSWSIRASCGNSQLKT